MTMPFEQWFLFEQSVVRLKNSIFSPMDEAINRWLWTEDRTRYGFGVDFQLLYELENGTFVLLDYRNCLPIYRDKAQGGVPIWRSNEPPVGEYIGAKEALDRLIASQSTIPISLEPLLKNVMQPESLPADIQVQVRELSYWSEKGYGDGWSIVSASTTELPGLAPSISSIAFRFLCEIHHAVKEQAKIKLYDGIELGHCLFRTYSVDPENWWGPSNEIPPKSVDISGLPWPDPGRNVGVILSEMKELLRIPLAAHHPKLKPGHPDYPTKPEHDKIQQAIKETLPAFEPLVRSLKSAMEAWEQAIKAESTQSDTKQNCQNVHTEEPYLGLIIDQDAKRIKRTGFDNQEIELSRSVVEWHLFWIFFKAKGRTLGLNEVRSNYPGEESNRNTTINVLNKKLKRFKVKIQQRRLIES